MIPITHPKYNKFDIHLWADYFELQCLQNIDGEITFGDAEDDEETYDDISNNDIEDGNDGAAGKNDLKESFVEDIFRLIRYRSAVYAEAYPFVCDNRNLLRVKPALNDIHKLYIYLLMCSHLKYFKTEMSNLTGDFELISVQTLKKYVPSNHLQVHIFGKNPKHTSAEFRGMNVQAKINQLALAINTTSVPGQRYPNQSTGDAGADIVAWLPFPDNNGNMLLFMAQCKCSDEWPDQRHTASYNAWCGKLELSNSNDNLSFIPYCYRASDGLWHQKQNTSGSIMFDRQRILQQLQDDLGFFVGADSFNLVTAFIETKGDIV